MRGNRVSVVEPASGLLGRVMGLLLDRQLRSGFGGFIDGLETAAKAASDRPGSEPRVVGERPTVMKHLTFVLFALSLLIAGCGAIDTSSDDRAAVTGEWRLIGGELDGAAFPVVPDAAITFLVNADGTFGGRASCNSYGGDYRFDASDFVANEWGITLMGCEQPLMTAEQAFMSVIARRLSLTIDEGQLRMQSEGVNLRFEPIPPVPVADLVGTLWTLDTLFMGDAATSVQGSPTLRLAADGGLTGSTGCRELTGHYVVSGDELQMVELAAAGECPADLARQDRHVISVLEAPRVEIEGNRLRLWGLGGDGLQYRSES